MAHFVLKKSEVLKKFEELQPISDVISYSSKTNPLVSKLLEEETTCMFSIHLENELININNYSRVMFLLQATNVDQLRRLTKKGVRTFVADNLVDLRTLISFLESYDEQITLLLRMKMKENTIRTEKYYVFGMGYETTVSQLKKLRTHNKIKELGIHFHRKTQNMSEWDLEYELQNMFLKEELELFDIMCIGGGLPSEYANTNMNIIEIIKKKIASLKQWLNENNITLMVEPGRFLAAPGIELHTRIIGIHEKTIIVDASVYSGDMDSLIVPVKLKVKGELEKGTAFSIKGITPCSLDLYRYKVYLDNPRVGDEIIFLNAGAYNFASDFLNLKKLETKVQE